MDQSQGTAIAGLIVEDDELVRMLAVEFLGGTFRIYEADNADDAIHLLEEHPEIRFVFTDVHLPGSIDGLKLAHYVLGRWPPIKLVITSAFARLSVSDLPDGGVFFAKPYKIEHVASKLREMVALP